MELAPPPDDLARALPGTMAAWLGENSVRTQVSYAESLKRFAEFMRKPSTAEALLALVAMKRGAATKTVDLWKSAMLQQGLSSGTINCRLTAVRSFVKKARSHELIEWSLDSVLGVAREPRREVEGPTWEQYVAMVKGEPLARNRAILRLMGDRGLRREEVAAITLDDFDGEEWAILWIKGKGRREMERVTLHPNTAAAIAEWMKERGKEPGPLFPVKADTFHDIVRAAGKRVGIKAHPHGLRHTAITRALDITKGDVRRVKWFSRHKDVKTIMLYDDARKRAADSLVEEVATEVPDIEAGHAAL